MSGKLVDYHEHSPESPLSIHALTVSYQHRPVLWDVDYDAPPASLIAIIGPNGAGKTTLMRGCLNLLPKLSGIVEFWGQPLERVRDRIAYVPQRGSVDWDFPVSVLDVVLMGRYGKIGWFKRITKRHRERALEALSQVGMTDFAHRQISQLSGGQQQRVFLARALVQEPDLFLMDEPFAGVDAATEQVIVDLLRKIRSEGRCVVVVHHALSTVPDYFTDVLMLNGRVTAFGTVKDAFTEDNLRLTYGGRLTLLDEVSVAIGRER